MIVNNGDDLTLTISSTEKITKVKVFTANPNKYILIKEFTKVNDGYNLYISADQLDNLESGVIAYIYYWEKEDGNYEDGQYNQSDTVYTDYYYKTDVEPGAPQRYELREYVDDQIKDVNDRLQKQIDELDDNLQNFKNLINISFMNEYVIEGKLNVDATDDDKQYAYNLSKVPIVDTKPSRKDITEWYSFTTDENGYFKIVLSDELYENFLFKNPAVVEKITKYPLNYSYGTKYMLCGATELQSLHFGYTTVDTIIGEYMFQGAYADYRAVDELCRFKEIKDPIYMFWGATGDTINIFDYSIAITGNCWSMFWNSELTDEVYITNKFRPTEVSQMFRDNDITRLEFEDADFSKCGNPTFFLEGNNNLKYLGKMPNLGKRNYFRMTLDISMIRYEEDDAYADLSGLVAPSVAGQERIVKIHKSLYNHLEDIEPQTIAQVKNNGWTFDIVED